MMRRPVDTDQAPQPGGAYSQGVVAGGFLYTAGLGPHDPASGEVIGSTIEQQTTQAMQNIAAVLAAEHLDLSDIVKTTVHLQHLQRDFRGFNSTYERFMTAPYPVRTTVGSDLAEILVEIDVVAAMPHS